MSDLTTFGQYLKLADQLIEKSSKDEIVEYARLLALNLARLPVEVRGAAT